MNTTARRAGSEVIARLETQPLPLLDAAEPMADPPLPAATVCPALGLSDDPRTRCLCPSADHRCYRGPRPASIAVRHQQQLCLRPGFSACPTWSAPPASPGHSSLGPLTGRVRRLAWLAGATAGGLCIAGAAAMIVQRRPPPQRLAASNPAQRAAPPTPYAGIAPVSTVGSGTPAPAAVATAAAPPEASPAATSTAPPPRSLVQTSEPTPGFVGTPAARSYRVQPGESLTALAERFGVPEPALAAANDLAPTAGLVVDQMLRIPDAATAPPSPTTR